MSYWLLIPVVVISWAVVSLGLAALVGRGLGGAIGRWPGTSPNAEADATATAPRSVPGIASARWATRSTKASSGRLTV